MVLLEKSPMKGFFRLFWGPSGKFVLIKEKYKGSDWFKCAKDISGQFFIEKVGFFVFDSTIGRNSPGRDSLLVESICFLGQKNRGG